MGAEIRFLLFEEGNQWVAQCLEYDIGAQGASPGDVLELLSLALKLNYDESMRRYGVPFAGIDPAPATFKEKWDRKAEVPNS